MGVFEVTHILGANGDWFVTKCVNRSKLAIVSSWNWRDYGPKCKRGNVQAFVWVSQKLPLHNFQQCRSRVAGLICKRLAWEMPRPAFSRIGCNNSISKCPPTKYLNLHPFKQFFKIFQNLLDIFISLIIFTNNLIFIYFHIHKCRNFDFPISSLGKKFGGVPVPTTPGCPTTM